MGRTLFRVTWKDFNNSDAWPHPDYLKAKGLSQSKILQNGPGSGIFRVLDGSKKLPRLRATVDHIPCSLDLRSRELFS